MDVRKKMPESLNEDQEAPGGGVLRIGSVEDRSTPSTMKSGGPGKEILFNEGVL